MPIPRPDLRFFWLLFFLFSPKKFGVRWSTFSPKLLTDEKSAKTKKKKKTTGEVFATAHRRRVQKNSRSDSNKRRGHSPGNTFRAFDLNQPVAILFF